MAEDDFKARHAYTTAHIGYALIYALLDELEKEAPGLRKRVWEQAQRSLGEYNFLDKDSAIGSAGRLQTYSLCFPPSAIRSELKTRPRRPSLKTVRIA